MPTDPATPPCVAGALPLRPFKPLTTRRDLATSLRAFRTAWTALSQTQILAASCSRLGERAASVLCAVFAHLEGVDTRERDKAGGKVVLERLYEFQEAHGGAQESGETIFKIQAAMLDLQSFATDFLAHSTGPSRLDLLVLSLPASQRALSTLTASLSALVTHYALPHPSSPTTWAAEDAFDAAANARALPRAFQRALALRGHAWETFLTERPAPVGGTPGARRAEFVEWCVGRNPLLRAGEGDSAREAAEGTPRAMRRKEGSWPPPASPSPSLGEGNMLDLGIATVAEAPLMRRAASQPAALPYEAVETGAPASEVCSSLATPNSVLATELDASSEPLAVAHESEHNPPPAAPISPPSPNPSSPLPSPSSPLASPPALPSTELDNTALSKAAALEPVAAHFEPAAGAMLAGNPTASKPEPPSPREGRPAFPAQEDAAVPAREVGLTCSERAHGQDEHAGGSPTPEATVDADTPPLRVPTPIEQAETQSSDSTAVSPLSPAPEPNVPVILLTSDGDDESVALTPPDEDRTVPDVVVEGEKEDEVAVSQVVVALNSPPTATLDSYVPPSTAPAPASPPGLPPAEPLRILALDGGGLLGPVPQLHLLASHLHALPSSRSPAQHFTLIAGTSSSALLAVILGRLGLSADAALALYTRIAQRALALKGPPGAAPAPQQRRKQSRWSRLFRRSAPASPSPAQRTSAPEARTAALAKALAELLPDADEPFASPSSTRARSGAVTAILAFALSSSGGGRSEPRWLRSDVPSSAPGRLTVAQAVLAGAAASPLFALKGWAATPTSLCPAEGAVELARALGGEEGREIELVSVGTGYASLRLPAPARSSPLSPARRAALEGTQQAAASNAVAAAALARKLEGIEGVRVIRLEVDVAGCGVLSGREEWETGAAVEALTRGGKGGGERVGKAPTAAMLAPVPPPTSPTAPKPPLKKRASRLSFLFGGSSSSSSSSPSPSRRASSFVPSPPSPASPPPPMSPTLTVPRLRTSISLDDSRRGASGPRVAGGGEGRGLYALGEEAWGSSGSVRSG